MSKSIFCLMGATATGKTALACELVTCFPFEIISIDSAMIYREMDIGTAKPDLKTLEKAPHHLINIIDPIASYSVAQCVQDVAQISTDIFARGKIPLLVGGTMMYFNAMQNGIAKLPAANFALRQKILNEADNLGWPYLHAKLAKLDPKIAARISPNDKSRIQRSLEICELTSDSMSNMQAVSQYTKLDFDFINISLMPADRAWLHARINQRFQEMLNLGFVDEVQNLIAKWHLTRDMSAMRCVGYRQIYEYLNHEIDYDNMLAKGCAASRQLAKRQLTWLKKWPNVNEFIVDDKNVCPDIVDLIDFKLS